MAIILALSGISIIITSFVLIIILLIYSKTKLHRISIFFNFAVLIWGIGMFLAGNAKTPESALTGWRIGITGGVFIATFFYHSTLVFCEVRKIGMLIFAYLMPIMGSLFVFLGKSISTNEYNFLFNSLYYPKANIFYILTLSTWLIVVIAGFFELTILFKKSTSAKHSQTIYFILGPLLGFLGGTLTHAPILGLNIYPIGNFGVAIYPIIVTYAILKHCLMDISIAITRTGIFVVLYTLILGLPFAFAIYAKTWLLQIIGPNWWVAPLTIMGVLATVGPFIYIYIQNKAESKLLYKQKRYQQTIKHASMGITRIRDLDKLLNLITHIISKTVKIAYVSVYLYDQKTEEFVLQVSRNKENLSILLKVGMDNPLVLWMLLKREPMIYEEIKRMMLETKNNSYVRMEENMRLLSAALIIPSFLEDKFMGFLVLGDKSSKEVYTQDDLNVFQILASQAALAIENAKFYEDAKEMHSQIAQAEKMATIGTMADGLSHQINNRFYALSLIAGDTVDTIKTTDTSKCSDEVKKMIESITHALDRIQVNVLQGGEVVKGLMKYSRAGEEGLEPIDLNKLIDNTLEMVKYKVKLSEIDFTRNFDHAPMIKGNMTQLQEAFFNFIDNAYDAIMERKNSLKEPNYRGQIKISANPKSAGLIEITVEDNGIGIKSTDSRKVFTPFFTTKASSKKGTGLGLYVIKRIIQELHKGQIYFMSEYKIGTKFIVELPSVEKT